MSEELVRHDISLTVASIEILPQYGEHTFIKLGGVLPDIEAMYV